jgi:transcription elongation factor
MDIKKLKRLLRSRIIVLEDSDEVVYVNGGVQFTVVTKTLFDIDNEYSVAADIAATCSAFAFHDFIEKDENGNRVIRFMATDMFQIVNPFAKAV